jgi:hypothetical protein
MNMNIGLIDVDTNSKAKKWGAKPFPNLALAKISRYHKMRGDLVEWYTPFTHYDVVYMAKVFNYTPDYSFTIPNADKVIRGGTGYDIHSKLPEKIDRLQPDYSIYPHIPSDYAYGFLTRGCPNKCPWCVVPKKEGAIVPYMDVEQIAIDGRNKLVLMDNNILAAGNYAIEQLNKIIHKGYKVDFNQALDARLVTDEFARLLAQVKWLDHNRIRFGCDTHKQIEDCERAIEMIEGYGFNGEFFLYTMIGGKNDFAECYERVEHWRKRMIAAREHHTGRCQTFPYAQPYRDPMNPRHTIPQWQKDMAQWVNKRMIFTSCDFQSFMPRKGFYCREYFKERGCDM